MARWINTRLCTRKHDQYCTAPVSTFRGLACRGQPANGLGRTRLARKSALMSTAHPVADSGDKLAGDPIDRTYLARFTMGNSAVEHEVLHLFADQVPRYLQQLRDASVDKAWQQAAHTIKGSASAIGAWRL